jgi:hypothetical protein
MNTLVMVISCSIGWVSCGVLGGAFITKEDGYLPLFAIPVMIIGGPVVLAYSVLSKIDWHKVLWEAKAVEGEG